MKCQDLQLAQAICRKHHLSPDCTRIVEGSALVFSAAGRHIIKIFPPEETDFLKTEALFLSQLYGRLPIQTPQLVASGSWRSYPYLIMEQLQGLSLRRVWPELGAAEQEYLISQLGNAIRVLHTLPLDLFNSTPLQWQPFIEQQHENLLSHHQGYGLDPAWLAQLPDYLNGCGLEMQEAGQLAPLHTELMPEHIFVRQEGARWTLSGLIDFEPAMVGQAEYEFCAVGLFLTPGNKRLFRLFLASYGYPEAVLSGALSRRIMGLMLLHRYSNLKRFLTSLPPHLQFTQLGELEQYWYGL
jgi:hygromycin-B 7''-O-kinase